MKYRDLHPSFLGQIDCLVCGNSDPGTSGVLSPYAKIRGLYFNNDDEPVNVFYDLYNDIEEKRKKKGTTMIEMEFDNPKEFYNALDTIKNWHNDNVKIFGTSREGHYDIIVNEDIDMDDKSKPSTKMLRKKKD